MLVTQFTKDVLRTCRSIKSGWSGNPVFQSMYGLAVNSAAQSAIGSVFRVDREGNCMKPERKVVHKAKSANA